MIEKRASEVGIGPAAAHSHSILGFLASDLCDSESAVPFGDLQDMIEGGWELIRQPLCI